MTYIFTLQSRRGATKDVRVYTSNPGQTRHELEGKHKGYQVVTWAKA